MKFGYFSLRCFWMESRLHGLFLHSAPYLSAKLCISETFIHYRRHSWKTGRKSELVQKAVAASVQDHEKGQRKKKKTFGFVAHSGKKLRRRACEISALKTTRIRNTERLGWLVFASWRDRDAFSCTSARHDQLKKKISCKSLGWTQKEVFLSVCAEEKAEREREGGGGRENAWFAMIHVANAETKNSRLYTVVENEFFFSILQNRTGNKKRVVRHQVMFKTVWKSPAWKEQNARIRM